MTTPYIQTEDLLNLIGQFAGSNICDTAYYALKFLVKPNGKLYRYIKRTVFLQDAAGRTTEIFDGRSIRKCDWKPIRAKLPIYVTMLFDSLEEKSMGKYRKFFRNTAHFDNALSDDIFDKILILYTQYYSDISNYYLSDTDPSYNE